MSNDFFGIGKMFQKASKHKGFCLLYCPLLSVCQKETDSLKEGAMILSLCPLLLDLIKVRVLMFVFLTKDNLYYTKYCYGDEVK